jgi:SET domain-containing protein
MQIKPCLYVRKVKGKGRGVFTNEPIPKGTKIEESPVVVLSKKDTAKTDKTTLHNYLFLWGERQVKTCVALGYCSVYNHSYQPNCDHEMDLENETMIITTLRDIKKGEELSINYNGEHGNDTPLWFKVK